MLKKKEIIFKENIQLSYKSVTHELYIIWGGGYNKELRDITETKRVNVIVRMTVNSGFFN